MIWTRRLAVPGAFLLLATFISSTHIHGESIDKPALAAALSRPRPDIERPPIVDDEAEQRFRDATLLTYQPVAGDLQFALQLQPRLAGVPRRPRDYLVLVNVSANQAGPAFVASGQIAEALAQTAGAQDRVSLWTVGTPE